MAALALADQSAAVPPLATPLSAILQRRSAQPGSGREPQAETASSWQLLILPRTMLSQFSIVRSLRYALVFWFFHIDVLFPVSVLTKYNLNYMMVPPPIRLVREVYGPNYRAAMLPTMIPLVAAALLFAHSIAWLSGALGADTSRHTASEKPGATIDPLAKANLKVKAH